MRRVSSDERIARYLDQVCRQLLWPPYRARVRRELADHILSHVEYLTQQRGFAADEALDAALQALGSPEELGRSLRQARFPLSYLFCLLLTCIVWAGIAACTVYLLLYLFP